MFITMIDYGVKMTSKVLVLDPRYDLGIKYQGQIYLTSALQPIMKTPLSFFTRAFIFSTMIATVRR